MSVIEKEKVNLRQSLQSMFDDHIDLVESMRSYDEDIMAFAQVMVDSLMQGGGIYWYGNGGSAADAQHMAAELVSRFKLERKALRSQALTTDTSILTAIGNDYSFGDIFKRQVEATVRPRDVCIGLSTSGNSDNVCQGHIAARNAGATTLSLLGNDGGKINEVSDHAIIIPSMISRTQFIHRSNK